MDSLHLQKNVWHTYSTQRQLCYLYLVNQRQQNTFGVVSFAYKQKRPCVWMSLLSSAPMPCLRHMLLLGHMAIESYSSANFVRWNLWQRRVACRDHTENLWPGFAKDGQVFDIAPDPTSFHLRWSDWNYEINVKWFDSYWLWCCCDWLQVKTGC